MQCRNPSFAYLPSVLGGSGVSDRPSEPADGGVFRRAAKRTRQQIDAAHPRQTAAPQKLRRAVEPPEAGAQQGE